jgi:hypothetical protein
MVVSLISLVVLCSLVISDQMVQAFVLFSSKLMSSSSSRLFTQQWQPPDPGNYVDPNDNFPATGDTLEPHYTDLETKRYFDGTKPDSAINLAIQNFKRQGLTIIDQFLETIRIRPKDPYTPPECLQLRLSNEAVLETELRREAAGGQVDARPNSRALYKGGCFFLDGFFDGRPIQRFWFLETIARIVSRNRRHDFINVL